jgi:hypothetical protein
VNQVESHTLQNATVHHTCRIHYSHDEVVLHRSLCSGLTEQYWHVIQTRPQWRKASSRGTQKRVSQPHALPRGVAEGHHASGGRQGWPRAPCAGRGHSPWSLLPLSLSRGQHHEKASWDRFHVMPPAVCYNVVHLHMCRARAFCRLPVVGGCGLVREASEGRRVGQVRVASESAGWTGVSSFVSYILLAN